MHHTAGEKIRALIEKSLCPACESPLVKTDGVIDTAEFDIKRLQENENHANAKKQDIGKLRQRRTDLRFQLNNQQTLLQHTSIDILPLEAALRKALNAKDTVPDEILRLQEEFEKLTRVNKADWEELKNIRFSYEDSLQRAADEIEKIAQKICDKFKDYADQFLHQSAVLSYEMHTRTVGESGQKLFFPNFIVKIRSEAIADLITRPESDQVSESQREYIDLAFRMALLDSAVSQYGPAMLVVETPEASLDTVFIERAGKMLRQFANNVADNRLIATCNLNGEDMIGWLLGTADNTYTLTNSIDINDRVINLLIEGLPTAGYRAEPEKYDQAFQKALNGS